MDWIYATDLLGTLVFAISGTLIAIDNKFDLIGSLIIGTVTAVGGGTLRDLLIGDVPVAWFKDLNYLWVILCALILAYIFKDRIKRLTRSLFLFDTVGIGLFTVLGVEKTLALGLSIPIALIMGVISASFGGVLRDVLCNEIPLIFRREIYATACFLGGATYVLLIKLDMSGTPSLLISMATVMVIRYLSVRYKWSLSFQSEDQEPVA